MRRPWDSFLAAKGANTCLPSSPNANTGSFSTASSKSSSCYSHLPSSSTSFLLHLFVLFNLISRPLASESPDRDCCEPLYPFFPTTVTGATVIIPSREPQSTVPSSPNQLDHRSTTKLYGDHKDRMDRFPISCQHAKNSCFANDFCNQLLQHFPRLCGIEQVTCSSPTLTKCVATLQTLRSFQDFQGKCTCASDSRAAAVVDVSALSMSSSYSDPKSKSYSSSSNNFYYQPECHAFQKLLYQHPCESAAPNKQEALPTCIHAYEMCLANESCSGTLKLFLNNCDEDTSQSCHSESAINVCQETWDRLKKTPLYGCICPVNVQFAKKCKRIFRLIHENPCLDSLDAFPFSHFPDFDKKVTFWKHWFNAKFEIANIIATASSTTTTTTTTTPEATTTTKISFNPTPGLKYSYWTDNQQSVDMMRTRYKGITKPLYPSTEGPLRENQMPDVTALRSTCHISLSKCEGNAKCRLFLEQIKRTCDTKTCDKQKCMRAIQDMYKSIPSDIGLDIAFCLCKNTPNPDEVCLRAQTLLHPTCAQQPDVIQGTSRGDQTLPACHHIAKDCLRQAECRDRLKNFDQFCSVSSDTKRCAGKPEECRKAMLGILGTTLRTSCACTGTGADFRELYDCIGWHRLLWVNPCVVEAQKDYHMLNGYSSPHKPTTIPHFGGGSFDISTLPTHPIENNYPYNRDNNKNNNSKNKKEDKNDFNNNDDKTKENNNNNINNYNLENPNVYGGGRNPYDNVVIPNTDYQYNQTSAKPMLPILPTRRPVYSTPPWPKFYTTRRSTWVSTTTTTTTTTLPPKFCLLERPGQPVKYIREGYKKRLYKHDDPECSELCECKVGEELSCKVLSCIERDACNTGVAFYSHASPFYQAYRGQCLCYSGSFICSKPAKEVDLDLTEGVYLFLGYSEKDEQLLKAVTGQGILETIGEIEGLVRYHNINNNKSECRVIPHKQSGENMILQAVMEEFQENRDSGNLTNYLLNKEKEECFEALESISQKINTNDADMRSHVILSMIKVSSAYANVPELKDGANLVEISFSLLTFTTFYSCVVFTLS
ncbi:hypothetical protein TCAL_10692 [Tigriopus californicus]|uniref:GDNF/GAS1 domain-containing protein n=1 Tax=Tigriopus californicus TaxID=6832 RepID=A0A553P004_TIGCA|nr:uncharacterized protein LOC131887393 isoform X1 [Tigriopus californicus]TRY71008.1 hypothetical protein TCAL_10692 [Tigriopus californicus]|eukprot:TCALIF_10692-PA protein Name:"Similar to GFRA3 GDNF family receptor alpha-3 (Homo sapiens)" AED:0.02 eAED:0.02 QI:590/1/1/1/0.76/0.71/14/338/1052